MMMMMMTMLILESDSYSLIVKSDFDNSLLLFRDFFLLL